MKRFWKRAVILLAASVLLLPVFAGCGSDGDWDYIEQKGEVIIGYDNHFAPMGFVEDNEDVGFDLDVARAMEQELGVKVKLQAIKWDSKEIELKSKTIDLIWNGYTITDERKKNVLFSTPYLKNEQVIVIRKEDAGTYKSSADLAGKKLVAQRGSSAKDAILATDAIKSIPGNSALYKELEENVSVLMELDLKMHDAAVMDSVVANYYIKETVGYADKFVVLDEVLANEQYGVGIRKNCSKTKEKIDAAFASLKTSGKLTEIAEKWGLQDLLLI